MATNLKRVFVVDVEATCWETKEEQGTRPNEIIEIGFCVLDVKSLKVISKDSFVVKPQFTTVSPFCTELTGWTQADIDQGQPINVILDQITSLYQPNYNDVWFSYGNYDRNMLSSKTNKGVGALYDIDTIDNPFDKCGQHINIKTLYALRAGLDREVGLAKALNQLGFQFEGRHHNGADDAANIAKIVAYCIS